MEANFVGTQIGEKHHQKGAISQRSPEPPSAGSFSFVGMDGYLGQESQRRLTTGSEREAGLQPHRLTSPHDRPTIIGQWP